MDFALIPALEAKQVPGPLTDSRQTFSARGCQAVFSFCKNASNTIFTVA